MTILDRVIQFLPFGRVSSSAVPAAEGEVAELRATPLGELLVRAAGRPPVGQIVHQLDAAASGLIKDGAAVLLEGEFWNRSSVGLWFQIFDSANAPADGAACQRQLYLPPSSSVGWEPIGTVVCTTKMRWAASVSPRVLTATEADVGFTVGLR